MDQLIVFLSIVNAGIYQECKSVVNAYGRLLAKQRLLLLKYLQRYQKKPKLEQYVNCESRVAPRSTIEIAISSTEMAYIRVRSVRLSCSSDHTRHGLSICSAIKIMRNFV